MPFEKWWESLNYPISWVIEKDIAERAWSEGYSEGYENGFTDGDQDTYNPTGGLI